MTAASLSNLCKWLGQQAESLGVEIYPGFPAHDLIVEDGVVKGVINGDLGVAALRHPRQLAQQTGGKAGIDGADPLRSVIALVRPVRYQLPASHGQYRLQGR